MESPNPTLILFFLVTLLPLVHSWRPWPNQITNQTSLLSLTGKNTTASSGDEILRDSKKFEGSSSFVHLRYHMGPVLTSPITLHPIWYGRFTSSQRRTIRAFLRSFGDTATSRKSPSVAQWWSTVSLYTDQTGRNISRSMVLGAESSDWDYSLGKSLTRLDAQRIIKNAITRWKHFPADPKSGLYIVLTADDVHMQDFCSSICGFHYFTFPSIVGYTLPFAWIGNSATQCPTVCAYPFAVQYYMTGLHPAAPPNGDIGIDGMVSVIAHEIAEIATNPLANAWYAGEDPTFPTEIADLCEGIYGTGGGGSYTGQMLTDSGGAAYNLMGGRRRFLVQWVWNPVLNYCFGPNAMDK